MVYYIIGCFVWGLFCCAMQKQLNYPEDKMVACFFVNALLMPISMIFALYWVRRNRKNSARA